MALFATVLSACLALWISPFDVAAASEDGSERAAATASPELEFLGEFGFIGGRHQRDLVAEAIERSVQSLPGFHHVARQRLTEANRIPGAVRIAMDGEDVVVVYGDEEPQRAPLDGSARSWRNREGQVLELRHRLRRGRLVQITQGEEGRRVMVWSYDPDSGLLSVKSTMSSPKLPEPVRYRLTFKAR